MRFHFGEEAGFDPLGQDFGPFFKKVQPLGWDEESNASDHVPVFASLTTRTVDSLFQKFIQYLNSLNK